MTPCAQSRPEVPPISSRSFSSEPPSAEPSSARITRLPARAAASAAISPVGPEPITSQVAMGIGLLVFVRVGKLRGGAQARRAADQRLVDLLPEALRPHEGLVVEAGDEDRGGERVDGADVEVQRGPAVLALRGEPVIELDHGGPRVGLLAAALAQFDECIGLRRACGDDAARAVILEGAAHQRDAVGEQRGGQRIALVAGEALAVEAEGERGRTVDQPALVETIGGHALASLRLAKSRAVTAP